MLYIFLTYVSSLPPSSFSVECALNAVLENCKKRPYVRDSKWGLQNYVRDVHSSVFSPKYYLTGLCNGWTNKVDVFWSYIIVEQI